MPKETDRKRGLFDYADVAVLKRKRQDYTIAGRQIRENTWQESTRDGIKVRIIEISSRCHTKNYTNSDHNLKTMHRIIIVIIGYGCETWFSFLHESNKLKSGCFDAT